MVYEAEALTWSTNGAPAEVSTYDSNASGGYFVTLSGDNVGDYVEFALTNVPAGDYRLKMGFKSDTDRARISLALDGQVLNETLDEYWYAIGYPLMDFGSVTITNAGSHTIRLTVDDKHGASAGYRLTADQFLLTPQ